MPTPQYIQNHAYQQARSLLFYVERAVRENDVDLLEVVRAVIEKLKDALALTPPT